MRQHIALLVSGFTQVGVKPHPILSGQNRALTQQFRADREGRTGGQRHLTHGTGTGIVVGFNDPHRIPHNLIHRLHHAVRRQAAVLSGQIHAAAGGKHSDPQLLRRGKLRSQQVARSRREYIVVVKAGGAAVLEQFAHAGEGGQADHLGIQILPDLIQGRQPVEQLHILHLRQIAGEGLIEVVMGVHQTGIAPVMGTVDHSVRRLGKMFPHGADPAVLTVHIDIV